MPARGPAVSKRWGKAPGQGSAGNPEDLLEEMVGTMFPIACSGAECEKRAHLMLPGDSPYEGGIFTGKGWTAVVAVTPPAITFLCAECFQREVVENNVKSKPRAPANSPVSG
ncbi:MAG: hypothetical protein ACREB9_07655 [Thermoplasmata archaeon]